MPTRKRKMENEPIDDIDMKDSRFDNVDKDRILSPISAVNGDEDDDGNDDYTQDPQFQHMKSTGMLMKESQKRTIFEMSLKHCPRMQGDLNNEILADENSIGFWKNRKSDGFTVWSPGMFKISERDPALGTPSFAEIALKLIAPEEKDRYLSAFQPVLEGRADSANCIIRCVTTCGEPQLLSFTVLPVLDDENNVVELCGCCRIVNDKNSRIKKSNKEDTQEVDNALERARKERALLEKAMADKNNFIAYVFHEVRNPINAVYLGLQALEEEMTDPDIKDVVAIMRNSTERAMLILNDTLEYSKFELGNVFLNKAPMMISDCVKECINEFKASAQKRGILLAMNVVCDSVCKMDKMRIIQVMNNLLSNALKFTPNNGYITVTIDHTAQKGGEWAEISVSDNGAGIKEEDRQRIFTPYNQIDNQVSGMKGMGIGLSISKKIIDAHYGDMCVQSTNGQGTTFIIKLPVLKRAGHVLLASAEKKNLRVRGEMEGLRVLIVDDNAVNSIMLQRMLSKHGCSVDSLKDGEEFLAYTRNPKGEEYDLIMLDDFMPNLDGSKAIEVARGEGFTAFTLMITGNMYDESLKNCGADEVIYKPLRFSDLKEIVQKHSL